LLKKEIILSGRRTATYAANHSGQAMVKRLCVRKNVRQSTAEKNSLHIQPTIFLIQPAILLIRPVKDEVMKLTHS